jgi:hypothetical protein
MGSNTGLGFDVVRQFLELGLSHPLMGVRSLKRGKPAADKLSYCKLIRKYRDLSARHGNIRVRPGLRLKMPEGPIAILLYFRLQ